MSNREINETAAVLIKAKGLIADKEKWCQGQYRQGNARCALGAIDQFDAAGRPPEEALYQSALSLFGTSVVHVNDRLGHAAVMQMFDLAISRALQGVES